MKCQIFTNGVSVMMAGQGMPLMGARGLVQWVVSKSLHLIGKNQITIYHSSSIFKSA